ncbi:MAG: ABC transporter permease, partial [Burkholderiales bacterium]
MRFSKAQTVQAFEWFIGLRYTRAKRRNQFISFITFISVLGMALGVATLIVILSVMNGFQDEVRTRILGVAAHLQITGADNNLSGWQLVAENASRHSQVSAAAPYVTAQGMLGFDQVVRGAVIRGVLPDYEERVADISAHMELGSLTDLRPGEFGIVLGSELAHALGVRLGEKVTVIAPQGQVTPAGI